jgi:hypothetical protein
MRESGKNHDVNLLLAGTKGFCAVELEDPVQTEVAQQLQSSLNRVRYNWVH